MPMVQMRGTQQYLKKSQPYRYIRMDKERPEAAEGDKPRDSIQVEPEDHSGQGF